MGGSEKEEREKGCQQLCGKRERYRDAKRDRHRKREGGMGAGENERERGRRERKTGVLPFKGTGTTHVHRDHTAGQGTACILGMRAGVKHSAKRWAGGLNAHKWYTVTLTCFFIVSSVKANESILLAIAN